jgi:hypothetical protein
MGSLVESAIVNNYLDRVRDAINTADERNTPAESVAPEYYPDVISLLKVNGVYTIGTLDAPEDDRLREDVNFQRESDVTDRNECYFVIDTPNNMVRGFVNDGFIKEVDDIKEDINGIHNQLNWIED